MAFNRPRDYYSVPTYAMYILVRRLEFMDPKTGKRIVIKNQWMWNISNITELG
ncbi:hypothetical protein [Hymenobacter sp. DG25B]|uniref:hypothetical protein n=1 Tax=Hymenobacter sp. DG25B TaxID=1385664 RepID=UPI0012E00F63|nr:hypothetical protein [Hymenobacter sp. DG25B]